MLALPLAFAGVGYSLFGSVGAAVGWLVGAWLFGPKSKVENTIIDPGAQEAPRVTQALRGATIPILFGTNRVAANVAWVKNFQTIRHENADNGSGGGKGGGSGMPGKGQQPTTTNVSYTYKWDMLFHLGMAPQPVSIFRGWSDANPINGQTILNINAGNPSLGRPIIRRAERDGALGLTWDLVYFGAAYPTGDTTQANWSYFESMEVYPCRWPNTAYLGFKALDLGASAHVPQMSFEVGPGDAVFEGDTAFIAHNTTGDGSYYPGSGIILGEDGKSYIAEFESSGNMRLFRADDATALTYTAAALKSDVGGIGSTTADEGLKMIPVPNTEHFYMVCMFTITPFVGPFKKVAVGLYKINGSGAIEFVQGGVYEGSLDGDQFTAPYGIGIKYEPVTSSEDPLVPLKVVVAVDRKLSGLAINVGAILSLPAPGEDIGGADWSDQFEDLFTVPDGNFLFASVTGSLFNAVFFLPIVNVDTGVWSYRICLFVNKTWGAVLAGSTIWNDTLEDAADTYPNGYVLSIAEGGGGVEIISDSFVNDANTAQIPFADDGLDLLGAANSADTYFCPTTILDESKATILVFSKRYSTESSQTPTGTMAKHVVFVWDPVNEKATLYGSTFAPYADTVSDLGASEGNRYGNVPTVISAWFRFTDNALLMYAYYAGATNVGVEHVFSSLGSFSFSGGDDVTPPYIIRQILTNTVFGHGIDDTRIDSTTYEQVVQYCIDNEIVISVQYTREETMLGVIDELLSLYGGYLVIIGGTIYFGAQAFASTPRVIDNDHLVAESEDKPPVRVTKAAPQDGYNKIKINYFDRELDYRQNTVEVMDEVDIDLNGMRPKEFQPKFVMKSSLAGQIAIRALWNNLYGRDTYDFILGWKDADLVPGDRITLVDSWHPELKNGSSARIVKWHEKSRGQFAITAVKEVSEYQTSTFSMSFVPSLGLGRIPIVVPTAPADFRAYELPSEFQVSGRVYVGYNQTSAIRGAYLFLSADNTSYVLAQTAEPFIISGIFADALPSRDHGYVDRNVKVYLMPNSGFSTATPTFAQSVTWDAVGELTRAIGGGVIYSGSEALAVEGLTLLDQNTYLIDKLYRGWGGTLPGAHSSGAYWHRHGPGIFNQPITTDKIGTSFYYKVVPYNFAFTPYNIVSITAKQYTIKGWHWTPRGQPWPHTFVQSGATGTASEDLRGLYYKTVGSGGCNVTFGWSDCAQATGWGAGGYGANGYGNFTEDVDAPQWRVQVLSGGTVVRCVSVDTPLWTYSRAVNSADFSGFGGTFAVRITPYNTFGDAIYNQTRSLQLIG